MLYVLEKVTNILYYTKHYTYSIRVYKLKYLIQHFYVDSILIYKDDCY